MYIKTCVRVCACVCVCVKERVCEIMRACVSTYVNGHGYMHAHICVLLHLIVEDNLQLAEDVALQQIL